ncbi:unnamed protein product [Rotaria sp. Silwood1]|nr:unnamed protein product [Rotaria sp. Silwood1]
MFDNRILTAFASVDAFVASTSPILTKFYLRVIYQRTTQELMDGLAVSMKGRWCETCFGLLRINDYRINPWTNIFKRRYNQFQEHQETNRLRKIVAKVLKRYPHLRDDEERLLEEYLKTL